MMDTWTIRTENWNPSELHHRETIFTSGNGCLATRGAFEEHYPDEQRATFIHGIFDAAPLVVTELANAPDWLNLTLVVNGERFALDQGTLEHFERTLDLRNGVLTRTVRWVSPHGARLTVTFERFASLAEPHALLQRVRVVPEFEGTVEVRAALDGNPLGRGAQGEALAHWEWMGQGESENTIYLHTRTLTLHIELGMAMRMVVAEGAEIAREFWDAHNMPTLVIRAEAHHGAPIVIEKYTTIYTSRDVAATEVVSCALECVQSLQWQSALDANNQAWANEWAHTDVEIEGDDEAQLGLRFNLFQLLIAAPRNDDRVSIGAKTLSGYGYRGHAFWDTEIFILPLFIFTAPHIAKNLLNYRYCLLPQARAKAQANGFAGAQFPWESADTGEEVTPTWVVHYADRMKLIRIWTGDIELHISADIAYAAQQYWIVTGDDEWMRDKGAELILDTAKFWASRATWNVDAERYEYNDVIGPDEYHEHVNNNWYTNRMAQWNLQTALEVLDWLKHYAPEKAAALIEQLDLSPERLSHWNHVIAKMYLPVLPSGLIPQFQDYFERADVDLPALEPRTLSVQQLFGIEATNRTQVLKQPDVMMLMFLLRQEFSQDMIRLNYAYYTPRTDLTYGSSLGPAIQAIMACEVGEPDEAYIHFMRALRADLNDVRGNANDGIHAASAGGTWQAIALGFAGLRVTREGWSVRPRLPKHWKRLRFRFFYHGELHEVEL